MSFFDDASLAFLPSGAAGKDGKAYSIKPTDGTGDFTFSRGSNLAATRVGADGLIEKGRENLLTQSNNFSATPWASSGTTETSGQSGYDGSSDAWLLSAANAGDFIYRNDITSFSGLTTISVYAKKGTADGIRLRFNQTTDVNLYINLAAGAIIGAFAPGIAYAIEDALNGWYRIQMSFIASGTQDFRIYPTNATGTSIAGTIYIQDAQAEIGLAATDYIESGATTGKAGLLEDEPRLDYSGGATCPSLLLEPQRSNLWAHSEYFNAWSKQSVTIDTNVILSPEGLTNASKLTPTATNAFHAMYYATTTLTSYVVSVYAKAAGYNYLRMYDQFASGMTAASFDLINGTSVGGDIEAMGNGWYRCTAYGSNPSAGTNIPTIGASPDGTQVVFTGDGISGIYIYGAQFESASYPTSYIPTYGSSVTRSLEFADGVTIDTTANHTMLYDFDGTTGRETSSALFNIGYDSSNTYFIKGSSSSGVEFQVAGNGLFSGLVYLTNEVSGRNKIAVQWIDGTGYVYSNGVKQSGTLSNSSSANNINYYKAEGRGYSHELNQFLIFNTALTDSECIKLTTL